MVVPLQTFGLAQNRRSAGADLRPSDLVIADNLDSHKSTAVRQAIRDTGAKLLLPPQYSPDLNPIEQVFQAQAPPARGTGQDQGERVCRHWRNSRHLHRQECANYFTSSG